MNNDLISRRATLQALKTAFDEYRFNEYHLAYGKGYSRLETDIQETIENLPVAFDKEEVLQRLINVADMKFEDGLGYIEFSEAINIVKKGGIG